MIRLSHREWLYLRWRSALHISSLSHLSLLYTWTQQCHSPKFLNPHILHFWPPSSEEWRHRLHHVPCCNGCEDQGLKLRHWVFFFISISLFCFHSLEVDSLNFLCALFCSCQSLIYFFNFLQLLKYFFVLISFLFFPCLTTKEEKINVCHAQLIFFIFSVNHFLTYLLQLHASHLLLSSSWLFSSILDAWS